MLVSHLKLPIWYPVKQRLFEKIRRKYDSNQELAHQDLEGNSPHGTL